MKVELRMIHYTTIVLPGKPLTNRLKWPVLTQNFLTFFSSVIKYI